MKTLQQNLKNRKNTYKVIVGIMITYIKTVNVHKND